jgi:hypothetical protein
MKGDGAMVIFKCRTCGQEGELVFGSPAGDFWCGPECREEFSRVVVGLEKDEPINIDPRSRLFREACKEVAARHRREVIGRRELKARELEREKPQAMRPLYPV